MVLAYRGLDKVVRRTNVRFSPAPDRLNSSAAWYDVQLAASEERTYTIAVECRSSKDSVAVPFDQAIAESQHAAREARRGGCRDLDQ